MTPDPRDAMRTDSAGREIPETPGFCVYHQTELGGRILNDALPEPIQRLAAGTAVRVTVEPLTPTTASAPGSGEAVAFVQDADCSHDRVMRVTLTIVGGAMAEWWQCGNCPARFELADSSRESMEDVVREVLCRAFEDGTELIPAFHEWYDASQWFWWGRALGAFIGTEARKREQLARAASGGNATRTGDPRPDGSREP